MLIGKDHGGYVEGELCRDAHGMLRRVRSVDGNHLDPNHAKWAGYFYYSIYIYAPPGPSSRVTVITDAIYGV